MKVAAPIASGFLVYIVGLAATVFSFKKARQYFRKSKYILASIFILAGLATGLFMMSNTSTESHASFVSGGSLVGPIDSANNPIGTAKGIFPGRVVWVHNPEATNEKCVVDDPDHGYFMSENMNQTAVDKMISAALDSLTGQTSDSAAWSAIFRYHNMTRGKGGVNYGKGEKIFIKINATSAMHVNPADLTSTSYHGVSETSVASVLAVLRQLVNVVGVAQSDIYVGDPIKHIYKHLYDVWHAEFPYVHYLDHNGYTNLGREKAVASTTAKITYSDKGMILRTTEGDTVYDDYLYTIFEDAEYILNIPMLKGHQRAGMTMFAKNHFGSHTRDFASHLHNGLVSPEGAPTRTGYGLYRVQVDLMSHKLLGEKNLVYIMDALWATDWELNKPIKWKMQPFNNDYTSSIFVSFDPVAIESVGYDFLRSEFTVASGADPSVQMPGVDDYLHQAADSANWPSNIRYDPNNTGVHIASLGVHEHWNNATDKKYTRNLGIETGIELIEIEQTIHDDVVDRENRPEYFQLYQNYPNPFNPSTNISFSLPSKSFVTLKIFDIMGRELYTIVSEELSAGNYSRQWNTATISSGIYFYRLQAGKFTETKKLILMR
ncbi:MAG: T9SS type A sorting domain-containing protein [Bacteroidota bacterium]